MDGNSTEQNSQNTNQTPELEQSQNLNQNKVDSQPDKLKKKYPILKIATVGLIALLLVLVIALISYIVLEQNKSTVNNQSSTINNSPSPTPDPTADWETYSGNGFSVKYDPNWLANAQNDFGVISIMNLSSIEERVNTNGQTISGPTQFFTVQVVDSTNTPEEYAKENNSTWESIALNNSNVLENSVIYKTSEREIASYNILVSNGSKIAVINIPTNNPSSNPIYMNMLSTFKFTDSETTVDTSDWKTYNSTCDFSIDYPSKWSVDNEVFASDKDVCVNIGDEKLLTGSGDAIFGFYINIHKRKFDSTKYDSLESFVKSYEEIAPFKYSQKSYSPYSGIEFDPPGRGNNRSFMFIKDGYIYEANWAISSSNPYLNVIPKIISSIKFTQ